MEKNSVIPTCRLVIIAGSAGSLEVILQMLPELESDFTFAILIVLHRGNTADSLLADLLSVKTHIPIKEVDDKDPIRAGNIYIAPGDYHILFEKNESFSLDASEKVNYSRPSFDVVFESAAEIFESSLTCILLSGANSDGTKGLALVKKNGGTSIVQQPATASVPFMPQYAIDQGSPDYILNIKEMTDYLNKINKS